MGKRVAVVLEVLVVLGLISPALAGEVGFATKPAAKKDGAGAKISFAVSAPTDVEVAVLGADGKVVRHLAAGVLGSTTAPPEPLKAGLAQELVWDGKDDFGKPAIGGPFTTRVRLGTGVRFGRFMGDNPYVFGRIDSIACDEDGDLYVMGSDSQSLALGGDTLRVFSPTGRYLRSLIPFPSNLPPDAVTGFARWDDAAKSFRPVNLTSGNPAFYPWRGGAQLVSASKKGGIILTYQTTIFRLDPAGGNLKSLPMWPKGTGLKNPGWLVPQLALSPDGKYIYYSNVANRAQAPKLDPNWPQGRVYRQDATGAGTDPEKFHDLVLPDYDKQKYWQPDEHIKRTAAYGIHLDAKGHLYVCDLVNQEIVELNPAGEKVSATKAPWPERVVVDRTTGDYYVVARPDAPRDGWVGKRLIKITGRGDAGKMVAEMPLPFDGGLGQAFALGRADGKPVLWLGGNGNILCVRDAGAAFEKVATDFKSLPDAQQNFCRIASDYDRDEVYSNDGVRDLWRYDGRTGAQERLKANGKPFEGLDLAVGYDGFLYIRAGAGYNGPLARFDRDLKPVPFPSGTNVLHPQVYCRQGIGYCEKGVGVGPRGEVYECSMYDWMKYYVAGFGPDGKPMTGNYLKGKIPTKSLLSGPWAAGLNSAVIGPVSARNGGVRVDLAGNIYVGMRGLPKGFTPPAGFEKDKAYTTFSGAIIKFPPSGGATVHATVKTDEDPPADVQPRIACAECVMVGAMAAYPGICPFSGGGFGGDDSGNGCVCRSPRFDLDRFGRLVFPNAVANSVTVLDNAGNTVLTFGAYGNFDSQYVNSNTEAGKAGKPTVAGPEFPMAWPMGASFTVNSIYTVDLYNRRIVRADLTWKVSQSAEVK